MTGAAAAADTVVAADSGAGAGTGAAGQVGAAAGKEVALLDVTVRETLKTHLL